MHTVYTTTITRAARRRGIRVRVLDETLPIFELRHGGRSVRCYNALTDRIGAATFHLAQHKHAANRFLSRHGFPVPAQELFVNFAQARRFLTRHRSIVVKPCTQWGGRGVAVDVRTAADLRRALRVARGYGEEVVLEQRVAGEDQRLILVNYRCVAAIRRTPATVLGDGRHTIAQLIRRRNRQTQRADPHHRIPLDAETRRQLARLGRRFDEVPRTGERVPVRLTSNVHTGGDCAVITGAVARPLIRLARRAAQLFRLPMVGIDFLVDRRRKKNWIIEISPDLAVSPPEGDDVARHWLDRLFPGSRRARR